MCGPNLCIKIFSKPKLQISDGKFNNSYRTIRVGLGNRFLGFKTPRCRFALPEVKNSNGGATPTPAVVGMGRTMEWAARAEHLGGFPRKMVFMAAGAFAKTVTSLLNSTYVHNADTLIRHVRSRPPGVPLITVSNHMSTLVCSPFHTFNSQWFLFLAFLFKILRSSIFYLFVLLFITLL